VGEQARKKLHGIMPQRGGDTSLTEKEMKSSVYGRTIFLLKWEKGKGDYVNRGEKKKERQRIVGRGGSTAGCPSNRQG